MSEAEIAYIERQIQRWQDILTYVQERQHKNPRPVRSGAHRQNGTITTRAAAQAVLEAAGGPMASRDLFDAVVEAGAQQVSVDGMSKTLARHPAIFVRPKPGEWALIAHVTQP